VSLVNSEYKGGEISEKCGSEILRRHGTSRVPGERERTEESSSAEDGSKEKKGAKQNSKG